MNCKSKMLIYLMILICIEISSIKISAIHSASGIEIVSHRGLMADEYYLVFGEIENNKENAVEEVKIEIFLFDGSQKLIDKINATSSLNYLPPGRRSPFIGYYFGKWKNDIKNYALGNVFYKDSSKEKPKALVLVKCYFLNETFYTHIYNNSTFSPAGRKATNNLKVTVALYFNETIVGVSAGFLNLPEPGLLWDMDTSAIGSGEPVTVSFGSPFSFEEIREANGLVASVESPEFAAQQEVVFGSPPTSHPNNASNNNLYLRTVILAFLIVIALILAYLILTRKGRHRKSKKKKAPLKRKEI